MRSAVLLLLAACAGESHGGLPGPQYEDWQIRVPAYPMEEGPITLDATQPKVTVHFTSEIMTTTSSVSNPSELVGMEVKAHWTRAKVRLLLSLDGVDPMTLPYGHSDVGNTTGPATMFEDDVFTYSFRDCGRPCVRTETYTFSAELLEGDSTELSWYSHNGVRLYPGFGVDPSVPVPSDDETFTLVVGNP